MTKMDLMMCACEASLLVRTGRQNETEIDWARYSLASLASDLSARLSQPCFWAITSLKTSPFPSSCTFLQSIPSVSSSVIAPAIKYPVDIDLSNLREISQRLSFFASSLSPSLEFDQ